MDDFNFNIENDILFRNEITHDTENQNEFHVKKIPVINKEAFLTIFNDWIKEGKEDVSNTTAE